MSKVKFGSYWEILMELAEPRDKYAMVAIGWDRVALVGGSNHNDRSEYLDSVLI